jgi:phosphoadenosine phosphosulfate reductase
MGVRPAGLDLATLAGYRTPRHDITALIDRIAAHLDEHDGYVAFSGGKDSTVVLDLARRADPHVPVCFFDSGLEFPETIDHIESLADTWRLNLHVLPAQPSALEYLQARRRCLISASRIPDR